MLTILGITQAFALSLYFIKNWRQKGFAYLAFLLLTICAGLAISYLYQTHEILKYPHISRLGFVILALMGPLFYLAVEAYIHQSYVPRKRDLFLFIVPVGMLIYLIPFFASSTEDKLAYLRQDLIEIHFDCLIMLYASLINSAFCVFISLIEFNRAIKKVGEHNVNQKIVTFVKRTHKGFLALFTVALILAILYWRLLNNGILGAYLSLLTIAVSYFFIFFSKTDFAEDFKIKALAKYQKVQIASEKIEKMGKEIEEYLRKQKPYLEADFKLAHIAENLNQSTSITSQVINRYFDQSYSELIGQLRVEALKEKILAQPEAAVFDLALRCGFNSKSTFNSMFKKVTGLTPAEWRSSNRNAA